MRMSLAASILPLSALAALTCLTTFPAQSALGADPKPVKPINVPVNTEDDEDEPHVGESGLTLFFTAKGKGKEDIQVTVRKGPTQNWPAKSEVIGPYVTTEADDRSAFATSGPYPHFLYFATKKDKETKNYDIYVAVKQGADRVWSAPTPVNATATKEDELHPWMTSDGKSLYFTRKTDDGLRQFVATRAGSAGQGGWDDAKVIEELPAGFHHATTTPDGKTMYLQGPLEKDRWGLFVSTRSSKGWSKPEPLDELNSSEAKMGDRSPNLTRDGLFLYFASDRPGGKGGLDLWVVRTSMLKKR